MTGSWFLFVLAATSADGDASVRTRDAAVRADTVIRFVVTCDAAVERLNLTTLVPEDVVGWQDISDLAFDPQPKEVFVREGQRYARFELARPTGETILEVRARVTIGRPDLASRPTGKGASILPPEERKRALRAERFLESDAASIRALARRITGGGPVDRARSALSLTLESLAPAPYNSNDVGAKAALEARRGDCTEYSDLLTSLLRADGIPARRCYGFLLESTNTPKHDWVEFHLDEAGWIAVDPLHVERGAASFESLEPIYVRLSTVRNDDQLAGYHFFSWKNFGGRASVRDEFEASIADETAIDLAPTAPVPGATDRVRDGK